MNPPPQPIAVAILGATGSVGQRLAVELEQHPWFEIESLAASPDSAGARYGDRVQWIQPEPLPARLADKVLAPCRSDLPGQLVFSALDARVAGPIETDFCRAGRFVISNASCHRMDPGVPLIVPEVNAYTLELLAGRASGMGAIVTNPNCTTIGLTLALAPIREAFGLSRVHVVSMQALSGAGLDGPSGYETLGNVVPLIEGEEQKLENETRKILGELSVSAACNRVPVVDGHTLCISMELERTATADQLIAAWQNFRAAPQELELPSAPLHPTLYFSGAAAPQPRLHASLERGMSTAIGRLRPCAHYGWKFVAVTHNTQRGAALGSILVAELCLAHGAFKVS